MLELFHTNWHQFFKFSTNLFAVVTWDHKNRFIDILVSSALSYFIFKISHLKLDKNSKYFFGNNSFGWLDPTIILSGFIAL